MREEFGEGHDHWEQVVIESKSVDGYPRKNFHSCSGELEKLRDRILKEINRCDEEAEQDVVYKGDFDGVQHEDAPDLMMIPRELSHRIVSLFAISVGVMEKQSEDILQNDLVAEKHRESDSVQEVMENRGFKRNLDLIADLGLIDEGRLGQIDDVRQMRNELVHNPTERLVIEEMDATKDRVRKGARAPEYLHTLRENLV